VAGRCGHGNRPLGNNCNSISGRAWKIFVNLFPTSQKKRRISIMKNSRLMLSCVLYIICEKSLHTGLTAVSLHSSTRESQEEF
jgi:hypothetical protein